MTTPMGSSVCTYAVHNHAGSDQINEDLQLLHFQLQPFPLHFSNTLTMSLTLSDFTFQGASTPQSIVNAVLPL